MMGGRIRSGAALALSADLQLLVGERRAGTVALGLAALIDGLWLSCALNYQGLGAETARALARDYLHRQLEA